MNANDTGKARELAAKLTADWQDVPAMADVVKQAKEMLAAAEK